MAGNRSDVGECEFGREEEPAGKGLTHLRNGENGKTRSATRGMHPTAELAVSRRVRGVVVGSLK